MSPPELETKVAVLEKEQEFLKEEIKEVKGFSNDIYDIVFEIKERMDRQNGALPHLVTEVSNISEKLNSVIIKTEKSSIKTKIMWGGGVFLITTGITVILKILGV